MAAFNYEDAAQVIEPAVSILRQTNHPFLAFALTLQAQALVGLEKADGMQSLEMAADLFGELQHEEGLLFVRAIMAMSHRTVSGDARTAIAEFLELREIVPSSMSDMHSGIALELASAYSMVGDTTSALKMIEFVEGSMSNSCTIGEAAVLREGLMRSDPVNGS